MPRLFRMPALLLTLLTGLWAVAAGAAPRAATLTLADGTAIPYSVFTPAPQPAHGPHLVWLPSEAGFQNGEQRAAAGLAAQGIEVWLADVLAGRFLPDLPSGLDRVPAGDVRALVEAAAKGGHRVWLVAAGRGAIPALRGARAWQLAHPDSDALGGLVLISPKLFVAVPVPGQTPVLMPVVRATTLPVFMIQPAQSPWRWKLDTTVPGLEAGGAPVYVEMLPGVRDQFYFRPDATAAEAAEAPRLGALVGQGVRLLAGLPAVPHRAAPIAGAPRAPDRKHDVKLTPYRNAPPAPALRLPALAGGAVDLADYRGRVVLVNFWASWCPPCVHEMPSLTRLRARLGHLPFTILAVNMGEDPAVIRRFLATRVHVDFPVLMDHDGAALKRWGVFVFPTSFVIGPRGHVRYALFGALDWDSPAVVARLRALMPAATGVSGADRGDRPGSPHP